MKILRRLWVAVFVFFVAVISARTCFSQEGSQPLKTEVATLESRLFWAENYTEVIISKIEALEAMKEQAEDEKTRQQIEQQIRQYTEIIESQYGSLDRLRKQVDEKGTTLLEIQEKTSVSQAAGKEIETEEIKALKTEIYYLQDQLKGIVQLVYSMSNEIKSARKQLAATTDPKQIKELKLKTSYYDKLIGKQCDKVKQLERQKRAKEDQIALLTKEAKAPQKPKEFVVVEEKVVISTAAVTAEEEAPVAEILETEVDRVTALQNEIKTLKGWIPRTQKYLNILTARVDAAKAELAKATDEKVRLEKEKEIDQSNKLIARQAERIEVLKESLKEKTRELRALKGEPLEEEVVVEVKEEITVAVISPEAQISAAPTVEAASVEAKTIEPEKGLTLNGGLAGGAAVIGFNYPLELGRSFDLGVGAGYGVGTNYSLLMLQAVKTFPVQWFDLDASLDMASYSKLVDNVFGVSGVIKPGLNVGLGVAAKRNLGGIDLKLGYSTVLGVTLAGSFSPAFYRPDQWDLLTGEVSVRKGVALEGGFAAGGAMAALGYLASLEANPAISVKGSLGYVVGKNYSVLLFQGGGLYRFNPELFNMVYPLFVGMTLDAANYSDMAQNIFGVPGVIGRGQNVGGGIFAGYNFGEFDAQLGYSTVLGLTLSGRFLY